MMKKQQPTAEKLGNFPIPFCASREDPAPLFTAEALWKGEIQSIRLDDYKGKWILLFFYASDFTFV